MNSVTKIPVDFNNRDDDGAVRLVTKGTRDFLRRNEIHLEEGNSVLISDGELSAEGTVLRRQDGFVVCIDKWTEDND